MPLNYPERGKMIDFGFYNMDCMELMRQIENDFVDLLLTDIPYEMNNELMRDTERPDAIRKVSKGAADKLTFDLPSFLDEVYRVTKGTIIIFCGVNQLSEIYNYFKVKQFNNLGTVRQLIWEKTNPSPMNGQYVYLSGIENAVYFKKRNAGVFNAFCKNTVFRFPSGSSEIHPTEKNHELLRTLIAENSNEGGWF